MRLLRTEDHPRIRGERSVLLPDIVCALGSPPHTRGKAAAAGESINLYGITPAYAGKGEHSFEANFPDGDHPRIRGER